METTTQPHLLKKTAPCFRGQTAGQMLRLGRQRLKPGTSLRLATSCLKATTPSKPWQSGAEEKTALLLETLRERLQCRASCWSVNMDQEELG